MSHFRRISSLTGELRGILQKIAYKMSVDEAYRFMKLSPDASSDEVKRQYRKLSLEFHPDRGGDAEMMKKLNVAREVIESGGASTSYTPTHEDRNESYWEKYRSKYGPKPSGNYSTSDIDRFAQDVLDKGLLQVIYRYKVDHVPVDAGVPRGGRWTYYRPFGGKTKTQRMPPEADAKMLADAIKNFVKGSVFDMVVKDKEAWITFESGRGYQSISFEEVKRRKKKPPGVGMKPDAATAFLKSQGLDIVAGGSKYAYWGPRGHTSKRGFFIRESKKTLRPVKRVSSSYGRGIDDVPIVNEVYYGKLTPELLTKWANWSKKRNAEEPI